MLTAQRGEFILEKLITTNTRRYTAQVRYKTVICTAKHR